jgi:hypothetical protein
MEDLTKQLGINCAHLLKVQCDCKDFLARYILSCAEFGAVYNFTTFDMELMIVFKFGSCCIMILLSVFDIRQLLKEESFENCIMHSRCITTFF